MKALKNTSKFTEHGWEVNTEDVFKNSELKKNQTPIAGSPYTREYMERPQRKAFSQELQLTQQLC